MAIGKDRTSDADPLVIRASALPLLEPFAQSFIDRWKEQSHADIIHTPHGLKCFRPAGAEDVLPVLLYLQVTFRTEPSRDPAMQALADDTGAAVLLQDLNPHLSLDRLHQAVLATLDRIEDLHLDTNRIALGGDGLGGFVALAFASSARLPRHSFALLLLATPILEPELCEMDAAWPPSADITAGTALITVWKSQSPAMTQERLSRLPPILLITAQADPFRKGADDLARKMTAADCELSAVQMWGTIHDFTWLPALLGAGPTLEAQTIMARTLRDHLFPQSCAGN